MSSKKGVPGLFLLLEVDAAGIGGMGSCRGLKGKSLLKGVVILAGLGCCWPADDDDDDDVPAVVAKQVEPPDMPSPLGLPTGLRTGDG